MVRIML